MIGMTSRSITISASMHRSSLTARSRASCNITLALIAHGILTRLWGTDQKKVPLIQLSISLSCAGRPLLDCCTYKLGEIFVDSREQG
jgi:hypothetical protein